MTGAVRRFPMAGLVTALALVLFARTARAQRLAITPVIGYETAGSYPPPPDPGAPAEMRADAGRAAGVFVDYRVMENVDAEVLWATNATTYSQQNAVTGAYSAAFNTHVNQFQFGGLYHFGTRDSLLRPYLAGSLGFTHDGNGGAAPDRTAFALGLGGGVTYEPTRHVGVRAEGRWVPTYGSSTPGTICDEFGYCYVDTFPNYLQRVVLAAGVIIRP